MANLGDLLVIRGEYRQYIYGTGTFISFGTQNLYIPYADYTTRPNVGVNIVLMGLVTGDYSNYTAWMKDFSICNSVGVYPVNTVVAPGENFANYFPSTRGFEVPDDTYSSPIIILSSGKIIELPGRIGGLTIYENMTAYENATPIYQLGAFPAFTFSYFGGSGATRGYIIAPFYSALDENGEISEIHTIRIDGMTSATNTIYIRNITAASTTAIDALKYIWGDITPITPPSGSDPYEPGGGDSGTGGGTGTFDGTGDNIDIPGLPSLSAVDTGFITLFNPSAAQLKNLANYMWSTGFDLVTFKKIFADPMDCILGLSIVPVAVPNGGASNVSVGNISTGVSMTKAASQYVEVDCGTLNVEEFWGAYLDYDPFTQAEIYLPYIGTHPLKVDDIMNKAVHVVYHVDILSGACTAFVKCGGSVLYEFIGQCSSSIPITGNDWTNVINGVITISGAIGSMVATGGASAPMAAGVIASTAVNSMKPNIEKSGSMSGTGGMLAVQVPYLILTRPRQALPSSQNSFMGYPSFITENLGEISGYTEIESVHLVNIPATEQELSEIESLLKGGVIL